MVGHEEGKWILTQKSLSAFEREESFPPTDLSMALNAADHSSTTVERGQNLKDHFIYANMILLQLF